MKHNNSIKILATSDLRWYVDEELQKSKMLFLTFAFCSVIRDLQNK